MVIYLLELADVLKIKFRASDMSGKHSVKPRPQPEVGSMWQWLDLIWRYLKADRKESLQKCLQVFCFLSLESTA